MTTHTSQSRSLRLALLAALTVSLLCGALAASAANTPLVPAECRLGAVTQNPSGCTLCHLGVLIINIAKFGMYDIAFPLAVLVLTIGGILLLTSGPSEERRKLGKTILTNAFIGLVIVTVAWLAVDTTIRVLTGKASLGKLGPWNEINAADCPFNKSMPLPSSFLTPGTAAGSAAGGSELDGSDTRQSVPVEFVV